MTNRAKKPESVIRLIKPSAFVRVPVNPAETQAYTQQPIA